VIPTQISTADSSALVGDRIVREIMTGVAMRRREGTMPSGDRSRAELQR
jgi:hypothetical protein